MLTIGAMRACVFWVSPHRQAFGDVWRGTHAGMAVAVKMLGKNKMDKASLRKFKGEVAMMART